jgi:hypothetical protein
VQSFCCSGFFPIPDLSGDDLSQLIGSNRVHATGWSCIDPIAAEWAREEFIIDLIMRDKAEALVANALALGNFFIIVTVTHHYTHFLLSRNKRKIPPLRL